MSTEVKYLDLSGIHFKEKTLGQVLLYLSEKIDQKKANDLCIKMDKIKTSFDLDENVAKQVISNWGNLREISFEDFSPAEGSEHMT